MTKLVPHGLVCAVVVHGPTPTAGHGPSRTERTDHVQCLVDSLPDKLSVEQRDLATQFICHKTFIFSESEFDLGRISLVEHAIDMADDLPVCLALRRHPVVYLPLIDECTMCNKCRSLVSWNCIWAVNGFRTLFLCARRTVACAIVLTTQD